MIGLCCDLSTQILGEINFNVVSTISKGMDEYLCFIA